MLAHELGPTAPKGHSPFVDADCRRDATGVIHHLGFFPAGIQPKRDAAWAVSSDGSIVVGMSRYSLWLERHLNRDLRS